MPGTFGVFGLILYFGLFLFLLRATRKKHTVCFRLVALSLLFLVFIRDAISMPVVMGNTAHTFFIWFLIGVLASMKTIRSLSHLPVEKPKIIQ